MLLKQIFFSCVKISSIQHSAHKLRNKCCWNGKNRSLWCWHASAKIWRFHCFSTFVNYKLSHDMIFTCFLEFILRFFNPVRRLRRFQYSINFFIMWKVLIVGIIIFFSTWIFVKFWRIFSHIFEWKLEPVWARTLYKKYFDLPQISLNFPPVSSYWDSILCLISIKMSHT